MAVQDSEFARIRNKVLNSENNITSVSSSLDSLTTVVAGLAGGTTDFATRPEVTGAISSFPTRIEVTGTLIPYAKSSDVSSSFARLGAAVNTFGGDIQVNGSIVTSGTLTSPNEFVKISKPSVCFMSLNTNGKTVLLGVDDGVNDSFVGTYTNHALYLRTNNTNRALVDSNGNFLPAADNTYNLGSSTNRFKTIYGYGLSTFGDSALGNSSTDTTTFFSQVTASYGMELQGNVLLNTDNLYNLAEYSKRFKKIYAWSASIGSSGDPTDTYPIKIGNGNKIEIKATPEPYSDNVYDLGSSAWRWRSLYVNNISATSSTGLVITGSVLMSDPSLANITLYTDLNAKKVKLEAAGGASATSNVGTVSYNSFEIRTNDISRLYISRDGPITANDDIYFANGKGINFSNTPNASSGTVGGETLNDYEEGSWSPIIMPDDTSTYTVSYTSRIGSYVKVGKLVTVGGNVLLSSFTTTGGNIMISGLPFAADPTYNLAHAGTFSYHENISGFNNTPLRVLASDNKLLVRYGGSIAVLANTLGANSRLVFSITYRTLL